MRKPGGYATLISDVGQQEQDCFTCFHCNRIVHVKPFADPADIGGLCYGCMKHICKACVGQRSCRPFEKWLDEVESRDRLYRDMRD